MNDNETFSSIEELRKENHKTLLYLTYRSMLHRDPDPAGLEHNLNHLANGGKIKHLIDCIRQSEEYAQASARMELPLAGQPDELPVNQETLDGLSESARKILLNLIHSNEQ